MTKKGQESWVNEQSTKTRQVGRVNVPTLSAIILSRQLIGVTFPTRQVVHPINQSIKWDVYGFLIQPLVIWGRIHNT